MPSCRARSNCVQSWYMGNIPCIERLERGMTERALQIFPYPRHVTQILRLAVAQIEACENAENLAGALAPGGEVGLEEATGGEGRIGRPPPRPPAAREG